MYPSHTSKKTPPERGNFGIKKSFSHFPGVKVKSHQWQLQHFGAITGREAKKEAQKHFKGVTGSITYTVFGGQSEERGIKVEEVRELSYLRKLNHMCIHRSRITQIISKLTKVKSLILSNYKAGKSRLKRRIPVWT